MLQNNPLSTETGASAPSAHEGLATTYTAPGKVFLLGEYAVLAGSPAVIAAVPPRFALQVARESKGAFTSAFHPQSPAGKLLDWAERIGVDEAKVSAIRDSGAFADSHGGRGGFGGSTAEFALVYQALSESGASGWDRDWHRVWKLYRELTSPREGSAYAAPSGADLVAQWLGGVVLFEMGFERGPICERLDSPRSRFDFRSVLVFSAAGQQGRKVSTHDHLSASAALRSAESVESLAMKLDPALDAGISAIHAGDARAFGAALNAYGDALREAGLEIEATRRDREALSRMPGVVGVKGAGALQADAIVVALSPEASADRTFREALVAVASDRGLMLVCDGITHETGVSR